MMATVPPQPLPSHHTVPPQPLPSHHTAVAVVAARRVACSEDFSEAKRQEVEEAAAARDSSMVSWASSAAFSAAVRESLVEVMVHPSPKLLRNHPMVAAAAAREVAS